MVAHAAFGTRTVFFALLSALALGCNRSKSEPVPAVSAAATTTGAAAAGQQNAVKQQANAGFPACLVGKWKSTKATLQVAPMRGEGGENVKLEIEGTGKSTIDFGEMAEVHASTPAFTFDFRYSGTATATLIADSETITSNDADWSGLRVSATANIPGIGKMPLVQDTPVSQLATLGKGVADSLGIDSAAPPSAPPAPQGIDASPVLSSSTYTCADGTLKITSKQTGGASWEFAKQPG
ncbi:MAG: hypothetical protein M3020_22135 [Myxococcota bacterium]|jgi:hypothetical protein|nr:hypothetical protein [Myxococcota bacterium]